MSGIGATHENVNPALYDWMTAHFKRGRVILVGDRTLVGKAVRFGQRKLTPGGTDSRWSHVFICGDERVDRRGAPGEVTRHPYIFESDFDMNVKKKQLRSGAQETWLGKWANPEVDQAAVLDLDPSPELADAVCASAWQLVSDQMRYPVSNVLDTWWAIVREKVWKPSPAKGTTALFCSAFVRHCYQEAGADFVTADVSLNNTAPEHLAQAVPFLAEWSAEEREGS
ncbi:MAG: hypothetical protein ACYTGX_13235 [Planctomycetota bacterium]